MRAIQIPAIAGLGLLVLSHSALGQIRVHPTGVNVNAQSATTVFLSFGGLGGSYRPVEAFWCGELQAAAPDVGNKCNPATLFGRLPARYDLSAANGGAFTDIMSIPASVARRAYDAASSGANSAFFYVRRFAGAPGQPDQYVSVTCRMAGGGARVPLSLTDVRLSFAGAPAVLVISEGSVPPDLSAEITYNGTGRLRGRWEIVRPGDDLPEARDLLTEATLPPNERGTQRRFEELSRFNEYLPPTGRLTLKGPDPSRLPTDGAGTYLVLLRVEVSDDKEGDSDLSAAGAGNGVVHSGAVAGFALPALRYVVAREAGERRSNRSTSRLRLLAPGVNARIGPTSAATFTWSGLPEATTYRLDVQTLEGSAVLSAYAKEGSTTYLTPPWFSVQSAGKTLRWRIIGLDLSGRVVDRTDWRSVTVETARNPG